MLPSIHIFGFHLPMYTAMLVLGIALFLFLYFRAYHTEYKADRVTFHRMTFAALLSIAALGLFAFCIINPLTLQWYSFISLGIIALYSGERGKYNLKTFFYLFYPIHLLALEGIYLLLYYLT